MYIVADCFSPSQSIVLSSQSFVGINYLALQRLVIGFQIFVLFDCQH